MTEEKLGEVEIKVKELVDETFSKYAPANAVNDEEGGPTLNKESIKAFI